MDKFWKDLLTACVMGIGVPWMVLSLSAALSGGGRLETEPTITQIRQETMPPSGLIIRVGTENGIQEMELESYLTGVVLAEMPASFETEALKAQSVVARTYALRAYRGKGKHQDCAVCTDSSCCQAYRTISDHLARGGTQEDAEKIRRVVQDTAGLVLTYEGSLIEATYFSCSGGRTEDAVAVWGTDVPYLQSVESPGEEEASHYRDTRRFTLEEFCRRLSLSSGYRKEISLESPQYAEGGTLLRVVICGKEFQGTQLRKLLELPSAAMEIQFEEDEVVVTTSGYGHRVGMSQYGADAMALDGSDFREILAHYYPGTRVEAMAD